MHESEDQVKTCSYNGHKSTLSKWFFHKIFTLIYLYLFFMIQVNDLARNEHFGR